MVTDDLKLEKLFSSSDGKVPLAARQWQDFLTQHNFSLQFIERIDWSAACPVVIDRDGRKFSIDFENDRKNYAKFKQGLSKELIARALGAGKLGRRVLDLSAGLGIDSVFLAQLGFEVTAVERNPLIYLCLQNALMHSVQKLALQFVFGDSREYLRNIERGQFDVIYFDPMFPEKTKSALPRQEMLFFRSMVGADKDAGETLQLALNSAGIKRIVVKRPIKAPVLLKSSGALKGKLIRFDIYGGES